MLLAISEIFASQAKTTDDANKKCTMIMDYAHYFLSAVICYHSSDMRLHIDSNEAYLVTTNARNYRVGNFYLSNHTTNPVNSLVKK